MHGRILSGWVWVVVLAAITVSATAGTAGATPLPDPSNNKKVGDSSQTGSIQVDSNSGTAIVNAGSSTSKGGNGGETADGSGGGSSCQWQVVGTQKGGNGYDAQGNELPGAAGGQDQNGNSVANDATGTWYLVTCPGKAPQSYFAPGGGPRTPAAPSPQQLLTQASAQLQLAAPNIQMSPPSTSAPPGLSVSASKAYWQIVQVPTWVWLLPAQWVPVHATAAVPGVTVTATAVPAHIVLTYQNGLGATDTVTCNGPGTPYSDALAYRENPRHAIMATSPDCGWTWHDSSAGSPDEKLQVTAHVVYDLSWTVTGAPGGGPLPPLDSPTSTYRMVVGEIQALNIYP